MPDARGAKSQLAADALTVLPKRFTLNDLERACPGVSREMLRKVLKDTKKQDAVACSRRCPGAVWEKRSCPARG